MIITIFDARRIQTYLFGSNRLVENIGASYLVNQALHQWPLEAAEKTAPGRVNPFGEGGPAEPGIFEGGPYDIELIYSAGGNGLFACRDMAIGKRFASNLSRILHERAPGLDVACHHHPIAGNSFKIGKEIWNALCGMANAKSGQIPGTPFTGAGVTERCATGNEETAIIMDPVRGDRFLGASAAAKVNNAKNAKYHLSRFLGKALPDYCDLPLELDDLGRSRGEKSFVGVVHVDGNRVGRSLQEKLLHKGVESSVDQLKAIRAYSAAISSMGSSAVRAVMEQVARNWNPTEELYAGRLKLKRNKRDDVYLPFRPLVYGGDDITFVCDGRIALDLAATCLEAFNDGDLNLHACAGVALVKSHYPFFRAYALAEELCRNAKKAVIDQRDGVGSAMDWHIQSGGPMQSIDAVRDREYTIGNSEKLTCRPYFVRPTKPRGMNDWKSFRNDFLLVIQGHASPGTERNDWAGAHSRLKSLVPHIVKGPIASELVLTEWAQKGYTLPEYCRNELSSGFDGNKTPFLDALELLDFLVPLN